MILPSKLVLYSCSSLDRSTVTTSVRMFFLAVMAWDVQPERRPGPSSLIYSYPPKLGVRSVQYTRFAWVSQLF